MSNIGDTVDKISQFGIEIETKNRLDRFKAENKECIIEHRNKTRRFASNTDVIEYLLDLVDA